MRNIEKINQDRQKSLKTLETPAEVVGPYVSLPSFGLRADELPDIKNWEVGKEYTMRVKVRMNEYSERKEKTLERKSETARAYFDIIGIEPETKS